MPLSNSLFLPMSGNETKGYFEAFLLVVFKTDFSSDVSGRKSFFAGSVVVWMVTVGDIFWDCPHPPLVAIREPDKFSSLISRDKTECPRCLLWHGWLPSLSGNIIGSPPWAVNPADDMFRQLESCLGPYCPDMIDEMNGPWTMSLMLMRANAALSQHPV